MLKNNLCNAVSYLLFNSVRSEGPDASKNMINMKAVLISFVLATLSVPAVILLRSFDQRLAPINIILVSTTFTVFLVKFVLSKKIREFFLRKASQKKTNVRECLISFKSYFFHLKRNKIDVERIEMESAAWKRPGRRNYRLGTAFLILQDVYESV